MESFLLFDLLHRQIDSHSAAQADHPIPYQYTTKQTTDKHNCRKRFLNIFFFFHLPPSSPDQNGSFPHLVLYFDGSMGWYGHGDT